MCLGVTLSPAWMCLILPLPRTVSSPSHPLLPTHTVLPCLLPLFSPSLPFPSFTRFPHPTLCISPPRRHRLGRPLLPSALHLRRSRSTRTRRSRHCPTVPMMTGSSRRSRAKLRGPVGVSGQRGEDEGGVRAGMGGGGGGIGGGGIGQGR